MHIAELQARRTAGKQSITRTTISATVQPPWGWAVLTDSRLFFGIYFKIWHSLQSVDVTSNDCLQCIAQILLNARSKDWPVHNVIGTASQHVSYQCTATPAFMKHKTCRLHILYSEPRQDNTTNATSGTYVPSRSVSLLITAATVRHIMWKGTCRPYLYVVFASTAFVCQQLCQCLSP
jgi:hypothetical protein